MCCVPEPLLITYPISSQLERECPMQTEAHHCPCVSSVSARPGLGLSNAGEGKAARNRELSHHITGTLALWTYICFTYITLLKHIVDIDKICLISQKF